MKKYWYMFCNRAGLLLTMHPLRRLAMSANNIVMNIFFGCRGLFLSGTKYNQDIIIKRVVRATTKFIIIEHSFIVNFVTLQLILYISAGPVGAFRYMTVSIELSRLTRHQQHLPPKGVSEGGCGRVLLTFIPRVCSSVVAVEFCCERSTTTEHAPVEGDAKIGLQPYTTRSVLSAII